MGFLDTLKKTGESFISLIIPGATCNVQSRDTVSETRDIDDRYESEEDSDSKNKHSSRYNKKD